MAKRKKSNNLRKSKNSRSFAQIVFQMLLVQFEEFCNETSMHGLKYVAKHQSHPVVRFSWIGLFTVGCLTSAYLCCQVWENWEESPLSVTFQATNYPVENINFPAITICNVNKVSREKLRREVEADRRWASVEFEDLRSTLQVMTSLSNSAANLEMVVPRLERIMNQSTITVQHLKDLMKKVAPSCEDMLVSCKWQGREVKCVRLFITRQTDDGLCCSFTSYTKKHNFCRKKTNLQLYVEKVLLSWRDHQFQNFFSKEIAKTLLKFNSKLEWTQLGLSVVLNAQVEDYNASTMSFDGFKVLIHDANDFPDVGERGFFVGVGHAVSVGIESTSVTSSDSVLNVDFHKRNCLTRNEKKLDYFPLYTTSNCFIERFAREMIKACRCKPFFYPGNETDCSVGAYDCLIKTYARYRIRSQRNLQCPYTCTDTWYNMELSYATYPGHYFHQSGFDDVVLKKYPALEGTDVKQYASKNFAVMRVYYKKQTGIRLKLEDRFGWEDIVSSMGGLLGLGFGFSFISAVEIFYFLCCRWLSRLLQNCKEIRKQRTQPLSQKNNLQDGGLPYSTVFP